MDNINNFVVNFMADITEKQENLIMETVARAAGEEYRHITVDKGKVVEAFRDYLGKGEQLPRINSPETLKEAIATYGKAYQVDRAIEEMSELTKALCKERRTDLILGEHAEAHANVIEEIADVLIMLRQLIIIFDRDNELPAEVNYKIQRLQQRLDKAKGETV